MAKAIDLTGLTHYNELVKAVLKKKANTTDIPTKNSQLQNDSKFITKADVPTKNSQLQNDSKFITSADVPNNLSEFTNDTGFITSSDVPTKVSQLQNDSGYINQESDPTVPAWAKQPTKPTYNKAEVGLSAVENKSSATIRSEITSKDVTNGLGFTPMDSSLKGANNGVAELDSNGKVPASQLPSYVDDVLEYDSLDKFPTTGETGKIYVATDTNLPYRWGGTTYVAIASSLALGETSSTAFRGDHGKTAYEHSQSPHAPSNAQENVIEKISVNSKIQPISSKQVDITVPTKVSELQNDSNYLQDKDLPTKVSQLQNDAGYITDETKFNSSAASSITSKDINNWNNKVDKVSGKDLSTNDYTTEEKNKLSNIEEKAQKNVQSDWSTTDTTKDSFIKNKPTKVSQFTNDAKYIKSDGSITTIIHLTYAEYKSLEALGQLDENTEYHIEEKTDQQTFITRDDIQAMITSAINQSKQAEHPIGSLEFNTSGTNPASYLGFGTWTLWGAGKVPIGVDTSDSTINKADLSVGSKTVKYKPAGTNKGTAVTLNAVSLSHSGGAVQSHTLTVNEMPSHNHGLVEPFYKFAELSMGLVGQVYKGEKRQDNTWYSEKTGGGQGHSHGFTQPSAHSFTPTTKSITQPTFTGTEATINVQQPSISCYMWKRTA